MWGERKEKLFTWEFHLSSQFALQFYWSQYREEERKKLYYSLFSIYQFISPSFYAWRGIELDYSISKASKKMHRFEIELFLFTLLLIYWTTMWSSSNGIGKDRTKNKDIKEWLTNNWKSFFYLEKVDKPFL